MKKRVASAMIIAGICAAMSIMTGAEDLSSVMEDVRDANLNEALLANNEMVAFRINDYDAEGNIYSSYTYGDQERLVVESPYIIQIEEQDTVYGFMNDTMVPFISVYIDDAKEFSEICISSFFWDPDEVVDECYEIDGELYIHTNVTDTETLDNLAVQLQDMGYATTDQISYRMQYVVNPDTYELLSMTSYVCLDGASEVAFSEAVRVENPEKYEVASEITNGVFSDDIRTVTVIADPDTDDEYAYIVEAAKGCSVQINLSNEHPELFSDRECTQYYEGNSDLNADVTVYTKKE